LFKFHFASSTFQVQKFLNLIVYPQTKLWGTKTSLICSGSTYLMNPD
jgi:hypothetical protein